jgi:hypothetical protein
VRNYLVDFLVSRAATLARGRAAEHPPEVTPGVDSEPESGRSAAGISFQRGRNCRRTSIH